MIEAIVILGIASLAGSGVLFRHSRMTTLLAAAGVLGEAQWLAITWLDRTILQGFDREIVYLASVIILAAGWAFGIRKWRLPYQTQPGSGKRDLVVLAVMVPVMLSAFVIAGVNGWQGGVWKTHGFFNGDTVTLAALVNGSMLTDGLVKENPFAGGGYLEYPTLLHAGLASLFKGLGWGVEWLAMWPAITLAQIALTVPMFFLAADILFPEPNERWRKWFGVKSRPAVLVWEGGLVLYVMSLSWDNFIFPQSHFFLTGIFILLTAVLYQIEKKSGFEGAVGLVLAMALGGILLATNAITGTAAVIVLIVFHGIRVIDKKREVWRRGWHALLIPVWIGVFGLLMPGDAAWGITGFSYTAAQSLLRLMPALIMLGAGAMVYLERRALPGAIVAALSAASITVLVFTSRKIVAENAERFIYHAILVGWPIMIAPVIQTYCRVGKVLRWHSLNFGQAISGWVLAGVILLVGILPGIVSVAGAHDNLLRKDEQVTGEAELKLAEWVRGGKSDEEVYITSLDPPWFIPLMTGKSILRADYWLAGDDEVSQILRKAFDGDRQAQEMALQEGDYLVLKVEDIKKWEPLNYDRVYENEKYTVWDLGKSPGSHEEIR